MNDQKTSSIAEILEKTGIVCAKYGTFYKLPIDISVETISGFEKVDSVVKKRGKTYTITFDCGSIETVADKHLFIGIYGGVVAADELNVGDSVLSKLGGSIVTSVIVGDEADFYDLSLVGSNKIYVSPNGIAHHNTFNVEKALNELGLQDGNGYYKVTGDISEPGLYTYLWEHRNDIILFDDADGVFKSQVSRNMIKAATDTKAKRKLFWLKKSSFIELEDENSDFWKTAAAADGDDGEGGSVSGKAPQSFTFTGRILFISNLPRDTLDPDGALRTRGVLIDINPTEKEVWDFIEKIMDSIDLPNNLRLDHKGRVEVVEELKKMQKPGDPANIRKAVRGFAVRASAPTKWLNLLKYC